MNMNSCKVKKIKKFVIVGSLIVFVMLLNSDLFKNWSSFYTLSHSDPLSL